MQGTSKTTARWRVALVAIVLAGLFAWAWQTVLQAGSAPFEPRIAAAFDKNQLHVGVSLPKGSIRVGKVDLVIVDKDGQVLAQAQQSAAGTKPIRFDIDIDKARAAKATMRVTHRKQKYEVPMAKVLLAKAHETALTSGQEFYAGTQASLTCAVQGVVSLTETIPHPGAEIVVRLKNQAGKAQEVYHGKADAEGKASVQFDVPEVEPGQYTLAVTTRSTVGEETLERPVRIKSDAKILLVSDKPIYQPGQLMHIRALVLRPIDMKPIAERDMQFEVEDSKGNKVFKKTLKTSEFGVASVDFELADEVNMGDYHLRANLGEQRADKTVTVKRYVLPKFKVEVKADKTFYLPKEKVQIELQSDYFFGKAVSNAKIEVAASTFDIQFRPFHKWTGTTDEAGHAKFEVQLPDYFVGQPLQKGNALVKLDVKVLDSADHSEKVTKTYPVSDQSIRVSLIPESGKLVPGVENRIFAAAIYPDGSPAVGCEVELSYVKPGTEVQPAQAPGAPIRGGRIRAVPAPIADVAVEGGPPAGAVKLPLMEKAKAITKVKTNSAGLAEFRITPKNDDLRQTGHGPTDVEMLGGKQQIWGPQFTLDIRTDATDARGNKASEVSRLNSQPQGENVLLRLDKAIYKAGDTIDVDVRTSAGLPTVYLDIVRGGQIMLSRWYEVKDGQAKQAVDLPQNVFGTLEIHAYQMLSHGEIIRDSRVVYVQARDDLKIEVQPDRKEYLPGANGRIRFQVTDSKGNPAAAALGVIVVDEAVYALQEMQPGLEKVYFTLQEELLKPKVQINFSPGERIDNLILQPVLPAPQQQVAEVLLTSVKLPPPPRLDINPALERRQRFQGQIQNIAAQLFHFAFSQDNVFTQDKETGAWTFAPDLLERMIKANHIPPQFLEGPFGGKLTMDELTRLEKGLTADNLAQAVTIHRIQNLTWQIVHFTNQNRAKYFKNNRWDIPETVIDDMLKQQRYDVRMTKDAWGQPLRLVKKVKKEEPVKKNPAVQNNPFGQQFENYEVVSAGADKKLGTKDDVGFARLTELQRIGWLGGVWFLDEDKRHAKFDGGRQNPNGRRDFRRLRLEEAGGIGLAGRGGPVEERAVMRLQAAPMAARAAGAADATNAAAAPPPVPNGGGGGAAPAPITKIREFFPETMLWQPALITDDKGIADLAVNFADSITTWRLSASANSRGGQLGGINVPLKVFQDFFVDIDLPVTLTQSDEIAFPVAVYNYLKSPQTVKIELAKESWFELLDKEGLERNLDLKPNEVTSIKFRIKAGKIGYQPLTIKAHGSKMSDAVKRVVEVVPNGQKFEKVITDRMAAPVNQTLDIPANAIDDASKILVRIYPGVFSQVVEGLDGMLRMPNGCFEQTSSSAYPNILIVDYLKKNRVSSPQILMKAEQYLNAGYQRLLTFERPGGGFDWWGSGEPLVWLSAYGLQEFSDMSKVYPIDRGIIQRTQAFLMGKMDKEGTWSNIGATHGETIASMGNPKMLLTSYVVWSLLDSGMPKQQLKKSVDYLRDHVKEVEGNPYILAMTANALASYDAKDDSTLEVLQKLDKLHKDVPEWKAIHFPAKTTGLTYSRGDFVTIESTALSAIAMVRTGQFTTSVNRALTFLVKAKQGDGTWGSTSATILSLKALLAGMGGTSVKGTIPFAITVNGKEAAKGTVTEETSDLMQTFDLKALTQKGSNKIGIQVEGETGLMYQIVARHFEPWPSVKQPEKKPVIDVDVKYDRTKLSTNDMLKATATLKYNGPVPTFNVILDLGIPPGFTVDGGEFAEMVGKKTVQKFSVTARQVILYLGDVKPGDALSFEYTLKPKYPLRAKTPATVAYEYYTPTNRAEARPTELVVEGR